MAAAATGPRSLVVAESRPGSSSGTVVHRLRLGAPARKMARIGAITRVGAVAYRAHTTWVGGSSRHGAVVAKITDGSGKPQVTRLPGDLRYVYAMAATGRGLLVLARAHVGTRVFLVTPNDVTLVEKSTSAVFDVMDAHDGSYVVVAGHRMGIGSLNGGPLRMHDLPHRINTPAGVALTDDRVFLAGRLLGKTGGVPLAGHLLVSADEGRSWSEATPARVVDVTGLTSWGAHVYAEADQKKRQLLVEWSKGRPGWSSTPLPPSGGSLVAGPRGVWLVGQRVFWHPAGG